MQILHIMHDAFFHAIMKTSHMPSATHRPVMCNVHIWVSLALVASRFGEHNGSITKRFPGSPLLCLAEVHAARLTQACRRGGLLQVNQDSLSSEQRTGAQAAGSVLTCAAQTRLTRRLPALDMGASLHTTA